MPPCAFLCISFCRVFPGVLLLAELVPDELLPDDVLPDELLPFGVFSEGVLMIYPFHDKIEWCSIWMNLSSPAGCCGMPTMELLKCL
jgi:hypothetical protein